ncbi:MAG: threonine synthase [Kiloniellales bacterium]
MPIDSFPDLPTFVSHLECSATGERYQADQRHGLSRAGKPLLVRYRLEALAGALSRHDLVGREPGFWRYREFLPVRRPENIVSLGETTTPIVACRRLGRRLGLTSGGELLVKDESRLPTGSFKARGLGVAVSMAKELGVASMALPTAGNAGAALAAYCARAAIDAYVFCPDDAPETTVREIALHGAKVFRVNGLINDCGKIVADGRRPMGWFDASTLKEPYRLEGKKTMGLELAEQLGWELPDVIFYPTGGGTGLIGIWKAIAELQAIGWLTDKRPRMVAVQAAGCAPIVKAWQEGKDHAEPWPDAHTIAHGMRVPVAVGDFLILSAVRDSDGFAIAVEDAEIEARRAEMAGAEGLHLGPEGATTYAAYVRALEERRVGKDERVVLFNCGTGLKYDMPDTAGFLDRHRPIDYQAL